MSGVSDRRSDWWVEWWVEWWVVWVMHGVSDEWRCGASDEWSYCWSERWVVWGERWVELTMVGVSDGWSEWWVEWLMGGVPDGWSDECSEWWWSDVRSEWWMSWVMGGVSDGWSEWWVDWVMGGVNVGLSGWWVCKRILFVMHIGKMHVKYIQSTNHMYQTIKIQHFPHFMLKCHFFYFNIFTEHILLQRGLVNKLFLALSHTQALRSPCNILYRHGISLEKNPNTCC